MILIAEKFATCSALLSTTPYPSETLAEAYDSMLMYDEHTWGMAHPVGPAQDACWAQKAQFAHRALALAQDILVKSLNLIADQISFENDGIHLVVFNPLSFNNTNPVIIQFVPDSPCSHPMYWRYPAESEQDKNPILLAGAAIGRDLFSLPADLIHKPFNIIDMTTGQTISHQIRRLDSYSPHPYAANRYALSQVDPFSVDVLNYSETQKYEILFTAEDVPPLGYKSYRIEVETIPQSDDTPSAKTDPSLTRLSIQSSTKISQPESEPQLENQYYRIELDSETGSVTSILDKELGLELVDTAAIYKLNQIIARIPKSGQVFKPEAVTINNGDNGPVIKSMVIQSSCLGCPQIFQEVILHHGVKRIDFNTRILRDSYAPLEIINAFPFDSEQPDFLYEGNYSTIKPIQDQLPGTNTDSYTIQHWLIMKDKQRQITFSSTDAAVVYLGKMWSGSGSQAHLASLPQDVGRAFIRDPKGFEKGHIFSLMMMNNFRTNFQPVQTGDILFRYSITSTIPTNKTNWQFGWQISQPIQPVIINGKQSGKLSPSESFLQIDQEDAHLLTLKAADDGDGVILRLAEVGGSSRTVSITTPHYLLKNAAMTNLIEEGKNDLPFGQHRFKVPLPAGKITTIRCGGKIFPPVKKGLIY